MEETADLDSKNEKVLIEVDLREAQMLMEMRRVEYGRFLVIKKKGCLERLEPTESVLLDGNVVKEVET